MTLASLIVTGSAAAQPFGIGMLLNPEGSRLFPQYRVFPRNPGKPDIRWRNFDWRFTDATIQKTNYRLYFYGEEEWAAHYALAQIHDQVNELIDIFRYQPSKRFSYLLFSSLRDFQQANIFNISEGVEGITSTTEATMAIPYWGEAESYRHVSTHELTHQFQVQKINDLAKGEDAMVAMSILPLWFVEGMAEYYSLRGMDPESRMYLRDLVTYPDKTKQFELPGLFEDGPLDFIHVYKVGQAKLDFFETEFGKGTAQRLLEGAAEAAKHEQLSFPKVAATVTGKKPAELEKLWHEYVKNKYKAEADRLKQSLADYSVVKQAGDTLDSFVISPDGAMGAEREIDPLTGITSLDLFNLRDPTQKKVEVTHDNQLGVLTLYFFQIPILALSDHLIAYAVGTVNGPDLEIRPVTRGPNGAITLGEPRRFDLHSRKIVQASSLSISPDEKRLAFVGLSPGGWQNVYTLDFSDHNPHNLRKITAGYYSWRNLHWCDDGILAASDRTGHKQYNIFHLDPDTGAVRRLTHSPANQLAPEGNSQVFAFQSWQSGSSQIHLFLHGNEMRMTEAKTGLITPVFRNNSVYALGFRSGRYHLYRIQSKEILNKDIHIGTEKISQIGPSIVPWKAQLKDITPAKVKPYKPFVTSGMRLDNLAGFFASGSAGGATATVSDLMRDYSISADFFVMGSFNMTDADVFFTKQKGRTKWTLGGYYLIQPRLDNLFPDGTNIRTYLYREFGGLGALKYPFTAYSFLDLELRLAGVNRTDFSDPTLAPQWDALNPGKELIIAPMVRLGYDRILYETYTGPYEGYGLLGESDTSYFPVRGATSERLRLDASYYLPLKGRTVLALVGLAGASFGDAFNNPFFISSDDILRAYPFNDARLLGNYVVATKYELRFPIGSLFGFPPLRGVAAYDIGSIFRDRFADGITSSYTGGLALNVPPIAMNFLFSFPERTAPGPENNFVVHFTLRYLYL